MNFQQLRIIRETVRQQFNLTEVANVLFTSQSGVSKHIKDLEDELGVELFVRKGKRFLGLTDPAKEILVFVERMLLDANNLKKLAEQFSHRDQGQLTIATTHTQACYILPSVVSEFRSIFPKVHLELYQGNIRLKQFTLLLSKILLNTRLLHTRKVSREGRILIKNSRMQDYRRM